MKVTDSPRVQNPARGGGCFGRRWRSPANVECDSSLRIYNRPIMRLADIGETGTINLIARTIAARTGAAPQVREDSGFMNVTQRQGREQIRSS